MTPDRRAWIEKMTPLWSTRAAVLRDINEAGADKRAWALLSIIESLQQELVEPDHMSIEEAEEIRARLTRIQPFLHPTYQVMFNNGAVMATVRAQLEARLGISPTMAPAPAKLAFVSPEPVAFTAGPQMEMFA